MSINRGWSYKLQYSAFTSQGCCNKRPQSGCLKTMEMHSLTDGSQKLAMRSAQVQAPLHRLSGGIHPLPPPASGGHQHSLASDHISLCFISRVPSLYLSVCASNLLQPPSYKDACDRMESPRIIQDDLHIARLLI